MPKLIPKQVFEEIERLLQLGGHSHIEIAASVGVDPSLVSSIANGKHHYQAHSGSMSRQPTFMPTPEEIEAECARLRAARKQSEDDEPEVDDREVRPPPGITFGTLD